MGGEEEGSKKGGGGAEPRLWGGRTAPCHRWWGVRKGGQGGTGGGTTSRRCCNASLVPGMEHGAAAAAPGTAGPCKHSATRAGATQSWCTGGPCKARCNAELVQPTLVLGARGALAKVHGLGATHAWCNPRLDACDTPVKMHGVGATHAWCNTCLVHVAPLQRCVALVQPVLGATHT